MASGFKSGAPPGRIWAIKNGYEIRYYTTPETIAQAIVDGYVNNGGVVVCYRLDENPNIAQLQQETPTDPAPPQPRLSGSWPPTAADQVLSTAYDKELKKWRKRQRARLVEEVTS